MSLKELLEGLSEFEPFLYCGAERTEVSFVVPDYSSHTRSEAVYVIDDITVKPSPCEVLFTCVELMDRVPVGIPNMVLVKIKDLPAVKEKILEFLPAA